MRYVMLIALAVAACSSSAEGARTSTSGPEAGTAADAVAPDAPAQADAPAEADSSKPSTVSDAALLQVPTKNGDVCPVSTGDMPLLVCFASDPSPYETYLGATGAGACPNVFDFNTSKCAACGPLLPFAAAALDAGLSNDCCYFLLAGCGP